MTFIDRHRRDIPRPPQKARTLISVDAMGGDRRPGSRCCRYVLMSAKINPDIGVHSARRYRRSAGFALVAKTPDADRGGVKPATPRKDGHSNGRQAQSGRAHRQGHLDVVRDRVLSAIGRGLGRRVSCGNTGALLMAMSDDPSAQASRREPSLRSRSSMASGQPSGLSTCMLDVRRGHPGRC